MKSNFYPTGTRKKTWFAVADLYTDGYEYRQKTVPTLRGVLAVTVALLAALYIGANFFAFLAFLAGDGTGWHDPDQFQRILYAPMYWLTGA